MNPLMQEVGETRWEMQLWCRAWIAARVLISIFNTYKTLPQVVSFYSAVKIASEELLFAIHLLSFLDLNNTAFQQPDTAESHELDCFS